MFFSRVKLPDQIRIALEEERLVVFAGAGVSMPPPSNLPSFARLASQIAGGGVVDERPLDRFLGKLAREKETNVSAAAAGFVYGDHTKPTLLHHEVLKIFGEASKVRVVTTNFDDHFSTAARKAFRKEQFREFCAPALPLGDEFSGLVYLHGSARIDPASLVLTDRDFGAAYLTRGWARDFLVSLFSHYTVLFVGYSHDDVTTTYLARGLERSEIGQRWAMVASDTPVEARENWEHLEISLIEYPIDSENNENSHQALTDFFTGWANHRKETVFTRVKRVKAIARALPPEGESDSAYLHYCLSDPRLSNEFCEAIRHPAWVSWMHERGYFNAFFVDTALNAKNVESQNVLAHWLSSSVRRRFPDLLLDLIRSHHQKLSRDFSATFARILWSDQRKKPDRRFATWVSILLSQGKQAAADDIWAYLLGECRIPEHVGIALSLFEVLTTPSIRIKRGFDWSYSAAELDDIAKPQKRKVDYSIDWPHESRHWLQECWTNVFEPHLPAIADSLCSIVMKQINHAYLLLDGVGKKHGDYDYLGGTRSSIASHEQDDTPSNECFSCLVDILRAILDHWIETDSSRATVQAESWWASKLPLLMRFAAYAQCRDPQYSPDARIEWVLAHDLVFRSGMKKEVFDILKSAYPEATERVRRRLLRRIDRGYRGPGAKKLDAETLAYEKFNVLIFLGRADPECELVQSAVSKIRDDHESFGERDYPEFDAWHGKAGFIDPTDEFDFDGILSSPPEKFADALVQARQGMSPLDVRSHLECLPRLFKDDKEWGKGFVDRLSMRTIEDEEIWNGVFWGWRDSIETTDNWQWILNVLEELPYENSIYSGMANLLSRGFTKHHEDWNEHMIDRAYCLMDRSWELLKREKEQLGDGFGDWLTTAINHVGGWIGEFWVHYCDSALRRRSESWKGIPEPLKVKIIEAVQGKNRIHVHARIALTPWIGYFFQWDREFADERLLPILDWQRDPIVAQQSWSVWLSYSHGTSKELEIQLIPFYRQCAERLGQFDDESSRALARRLAMLLIHVIPDPVDSGFLRDFLPLLPDDIRGSLAIGMEHQLKDLDDPNRQRVWETWLRRYLELRLVGVPVGLSTSETKHMLAWCLHLGPAFAEAVELVWQMPQEDVFAYSVTRDLSEHPSVDESPLAACRLAISALKEEDHPHLHDALTVLHEKFKKTIRSEPEFKTFEEQLFRRGWKKR